MVFSVVHFSLICLLCGVQRGAFLNDLLVVWCSAWCISHWFVCCVVFSVVYFSMICLLCGVQRGVFLNDLLVVWCSAWCISH